MHSVRRTTNAACASTGKVLCQRAPDHGRILLGDQAVRGGEDAEEIPPDEQRGESGERVPRTGVGCAGGAAERVWGESRRGRGKIGGGRRGEVEV